MNGNVRGPDEGVLGAKMRNVTGNWKGRWHASSPRRRGPEAISHPPISAVLRCRTGKVGVSDSSTLYKTTTTGTYAEIEIDVQELHKESLRYSYTLMVEGAQLLSTSVQFGE